MAQFYFSDEELNLVAGELDSFDGRKDPERCTALVNQLRHCQDRVGIMKGNDIMKGASMLWRNFLFRRIVIRYSQLLYFCIIAAISLM